MRCHSFCLFFIITFDCDRSRGIEQGCQKNIVCSYGSSVQIRFKATDQYYSTDAGKQIPGVMQTEETFVRQPERELNKALAIYRKQDRSFKQRIKKAAMNLTAVDAETIIRLATYGIVHLELRATPIHVPEKPYYLCY